jgi:hypothetical protein
MRHNDTAEIIITVIVGIVVVATLALEYLKGRR